MYPNFSLSRENYINSILPSTISNQGITLQGLNTILGICRNIAFASFCLRLQRTNDPQCKYICGHTCMCVCMYVCVCVDAWLHVRIFVVARISFSWVIHPLFHTVKYPSSGHYMYLSNLILLVLAYPYGFFQLHKPLSLINEKMCSYKSEGGWKDPIIC